MSGLEINPGPPDGDPGSPETFKIDPAGVNPGPPDGPGGDELPAVQNPAGLNPGPPNVGVQPGPPNAEGMGRMKKVGSLDVSTAFIGVTPVQSRSFQVPAGVPPGTQVFAMAVALVQAGTLNAFGAVTSNGVASFVNAF